MNPLTNIKNIKKLSEQELTKGWKTSWHDQYKGSAWIFIGGLPFDLSEGDILTVFSQYGEITTVNLVRDKETGKSRGFCFLCYEDQRSTVLAVDNFNGMKLLNRTIRVDHVQDYKPPKAPKKKGDDGEQTTENKERETLPPVKLEKPVEIATKAKSQLSPVQLNPYKKQKKSKKTKKAKKKKDRENSSDSDEETERKKRCKKKLKQASSSSSSSSETSSSSDSSSESSSSEDEKRKHKSKSTGKKHKKRKRCSSTDSSEEEKSTKKKHKHDTHKSKSSSRHISDEGKSSSESFRMADVKIKKEVISDDESIARGNLSSRNNFDAVQKEQFKNSFRHSREQQGEYRNDDRDFNKGQSTSVQYSSRNEKYGDERKSRREQDQHQQHRELNTRRNRSRERNGDMSKSIEHKNRFREHSFEERGRSNEKERRRSRSNDRRNERPPSPYRKRESEKYRR